MVSWKEWNVNKGLRRFSKWFDDFLLEVAKPLAIVGFAMGTVDIFTRGGIATDPWFNVPWAIVQATTIDGLFFAVWYRIFETEWKWTETGTNLLLVFIGLVLGLVAMITNGILSLQQLRGIPDSLQAMSWLGIDPITFTIGRAVLVVFVSVMVAFVYHQRGTVQLAGDASGQGEPAGRESRQLAVQPEQRGEQWNTDWDTVLNSTNNYWNNYGTIWRTPLFSDLSWVEHSGTVPEQPRTVIVQEVEQVGQPEEQVFLITGRSEDSDQDKVKAAMYARMKNKRPINLVEVAGETGVVYGKVRKLAPAIKKELGV